MSLDKKEYLKINGAGVSEFVSASAYKLYLESNFPPAASKVNVNILKQLSAAVDDIELGPTTSNTPELNVRHASIELLEECRKMLLEIDTNPDLSGAQKIGERKDILDLLEMIRLANASESNWKWTNDFVSSSATKFKESLTWGNLGKSIFAVIICVVVSTLAKLGLLAGLAAFASYAFPFVLVAVGLFYARKAWLGLSQAWEDADKIAIKAKDAKGTEVIKTVAYFANSDLITAKKELEGPAAEISAAEKDYIKKSQDCEDFKTSVVVPIEKEIQELKIEHSRLIDLVKELDHDIKDLVSGREKARLEEKKRECIVRINKIEDQYHSLETKMSSPTGGAKTTLESKRKVADAAKREYDRLSAPTATFAQKQTAYANAKRKQEMAQIRADKKDNPDTAPSTVKSRLKAGSPPAKPAVSDKSGGMPFRK